jgi:hypothetical protein
MPDQSRDVSPGLQPGTVRTRDGATLRPPADWELLPPGDAMLTRRVKQAGPSWTVSEKKGRKVFSRGVWAPKERIERIRAEVEAERQDPAYTKKLAAGRARRAEQQQDYIVDFRAAVLQFLAFAPLHAELADAVATAIAAHATPVGSGTVARTERIPIHERAAAATIAWLRHHTTGYDDMQVPRVRGARRELRRLLAARSHELLQCYRRGDAVDPPHCLLRRALLRHGGDPADAAAAP